MKNRRFNCYELTNNCCANLVDLSESTTYKWLLLGKNRDKQKIIRSNHIKMKKEPSYTKILIQKKIGNQLLLKSFKKNSKIKKDFDSQPHDIAY